ncbi:MAG: cytochrome P450 [Raineya sp.]|jgi:cytochrome P450|nr:cytochrome P450 [Raineya sp.]
MLLKTNIAFNFLKNAALYSASEQCYEQGDFMLLPIPFRRIFMVNDAEVLHHILIKNEEKYVKSKIYWQELRQIIGNAMGTAQGQEWLELRKMQNIYFTPLAVANYLDDLAQETHFITQNLPKLFSPITLNAHFNVRMILRYIFGAEENTTIPTIYEAIENGENLIAWRSKFPWRKFTSMFDKRQKIAKKSLHFLSSWTESLLETIPQKSEKLLRELKKNGYPHNHIRNELIVHLGAGTETLAVANTWILYLLSKYPEKLKKLQTEIDYLTQNEAIEIQHIKQMPYLEQVIQEGLRLYPPSHALVRDAITTDIIHNKSIKKGDTMYISVYGIHRNPRYWQNPDVFLPERFASENKTNIQSHTFIPFGAGKHTCIGKYLAMPAMMLFIAHFVQKYHFTLQNEGIIHPVSLSTLKPSQHLLFNLTPRK